MTRQFRTSEDNTWGPISRSFPSITEDKNSSTRQIIVSKDGASSHIGLLEADVIETLVNYTFLPTQLAAKWLDPDDDVAGLDISSTSELLSGFDKLQQWIDLGLIYEDAGINGSFIRPMKPAFMMANMEPPKFTDIPYNLLHHTVGTANAHFKILRGELETLKGLDTPRYSNVLKTGVQLGSNAFPEARIRVFAPDVDKYLNAEHEVREAIKRREVITPEFKEIWKFLIFSTRQLKKNESELDLSQLSSYDIHIPDIIVPIPRNFEGAKFLKDSASSIAVEVELTDKGRFRYEHTLEKYSNQNRFGSVLWLASPKNIITINSAVQKLGMSASTSPGIYYEEFQVPRVNSIFK